MRGGSHSEVVAWAAQEIREHLGRGDRESAKQTILDLSKVVPFPTVDTVIAEYDDPNHRGWLWGQWGPSDDLMADGFASTEDSFAKAAADLMTTKGMQEGRQLEAEMQGIQGAYYSAMMESSTCPLCASLDGVEVRYPSEEFDRIQPPQHCNCNCILLYTDEEETNFNPATPSMDALREHVKSADPDGFTIDELLEKHGHANHWMETQRAVQKDERDLRVTHRTITREYLRTVEEFGEVPAGTLPDAPKRVSGSKKKSPGEGPAKGGNEKKRETQSDGAGGRNTPPPPGSSGGGGVEPPSGGDEPPMRTPEPDWKEVPENWLDEKRSDDPEIAKLQEFLGKDVKSEVIREHLLAEGIGKPGELEIKSIEVRSYEDKCIIESWLQVTGKAWKEIDQETGLYVEAKDSKEIKTSSIKMIRSFDKDADGNIHSINFGKIGVGEAKLPDNFADEYYLRAVPFLQKIGTKTINITAMTEGDDPHSKEGRLSGAYAWCKYGYTNPDIENTIKEFLNYLRDDREIKLNDNEAIVIKSWSRMKDFAEYEIIRNGKVLQPGKAFLLGDDGTGNYTRDIMWQGIIPDINDKNSKEMGEIFDKLAKSKQK